jgi:hypothetical protein
MATLHDIDPARVPTVGDEVALPVVQSATRSTLFPDQAVVATTPDFLELVLLRQEFVIVRQKGKVVKVNDDIFGLDIVETDTRPQMYDIGHVRFALNNGVDLAIAVLAQVVKNNGMDKGALLARIVAAMGE